MHFCIPVSQQQPDALGGRYTVRRGRGTAGRGGGACTAGAALLAGLIGNRAALFAVVLRVPGRAPLLQGALQPAASLEWTGERVRAATSQFA